MRNKPYKFSTNKTNQIFELIHLDVVGPVTPSINNNKYFLSILDDHTRYECIVFSVRKSDIFNKSIIWYNEIYNFFNIKVKSIKSDKGKEFSNNSFQNFCQENRINHNFTVSYNLSQNGNIERLNGILISSAKTLLNETKLRRNFWEFVVDMVIFIHNRLLHQGIQNKIQYEILYNKPINFNNYCGFGYCVYFFAPKELHSKFDKTHILLSFLVIVIIQMHTKSSTNNKIVTIIIKIKQLINKLKNQ